MNITSLIIAVALNLEQLYDKTSDLGIIKRAAKYSAILIQRACNYKHMKCC